MIVAMKKVAVITQGKDKLSALDKLRSLGLFHVQHTQPPKGKDIGVLNEQIALVSQALSVLPDASAKVVFDTPMADWQFITRHIIDLYKRKDQLGQYLQRLSVSIRQYEEWGDFDPQSFQDLAMNNIFAGLYQLPVKVLAQLPRNIAVAEISVKGGIANCLLASEK